MEIAIFGGTFNPPTNAHLEIVQKTVDLPFIDEVWVMPSGQRDDKNFDTHNNHRIAMVKLMISHVATQKVIRLETTEIKARQNTQTADTAKLLNSKHPNKRFWYVFGADSYADMPNWNNGLQLRKELNAIVVPRSGHGIDLPKNAVLLPVPNQKVTSSTEVRDLRTKGQHIDHLVCDGVLRYIHKHALYEQPK